MCIQRGLLQNARPGKLFLRVGCPQFPPPPRGSAEVLVFDGKHGTGHGNGGDAAVITDTVLNRIGLNGSQLGVVNVRVLRHFRNSFPKTHSPPRT